MKGRGDESYADPHLRVQAYANVDFVFAKPDWVSRADMKFRAKVSNWTNIVHFDWRASES